MTTAQDFQDQVNEITPLLTGGFGMTEIEDHLKVILGMLAELWQRVEALEQAKKP